MSALVVQPGARAGRCRGAGASSPTASTLAQRVKREYLEMPGLRLTIRQAARLWAIEPIDCERLLDALVEARFLIRTTDGKYERCKVCGVQHQ